MTIKCEFIEKKRKKEKQEGQKDTVITKEHSLPQLFIRAILSLRMRYSDQLPMKHVPNLKKD